MLIDLMALKGKAFTTTRAVYWEALALRPDKPEEEHGVSFFMELYSVAFLELNKEWYIHGCSRKNFKSVMAKTKLLIEDLLRDSNSTTELREKCMRLGVLQ